VRLVFEPQFGGKANVWIGFAHIWQFLDLTSRNLIEHLTLTRSWSVAFFLAPHTAHLAPRGDHNRIEQSRLHQPPRSHLL
jgi:hypothetical protein